MTDLLVHRPARPVPREVRQRMALRIAEVLAPTPLSLWIRRCAVPAVALSLLGYLVITSIWPAHWVQIDMQVYRFGAQQVLAGAPLYANGMRGSTHDLLFNYPPFAAWLFVPLTALPVATLRVVTFLGNLTLLALTIRRCWRAVGVVDTPSLTTLTALCTGLLLWSQPVQTTIDLGQVNLLLLALVALDLLPTRPHRWQGVWIGIAAGVKLTPLLFIPYLLCLGRVRAAAVATAGFLGTLAVGFLATPADAARYWFAGTFADLSRIAAPEATGNQSLRGLLARAGLPDEAWLVSASLIGAASLAVAACATRRGRPLLGFALIGLCSAAISPFSWSYHWVWFVPLVVHVTHQALRHRHPARVLALAALTAATAAWITGHRDPHSGQLPPTGVITWEIGGWLEPLARNTYLIAFGLTLVLTAAVAAGRTGRDGWRSHPSRPSWALGGSVRRWFRVSP